MKYYTKVFIALIAFFLLCCVGDCQTTTISATVTDSEGQVWAGGSWQAVFAPNPNQPNINIYNINGVPLDNNLLHYAGNLDASGSFTQGGVYDNKQVLPTGSTWNVTVCPNASVLCTTVVGITITGTTMNISSLLNGAIRPPNFPATLTSHSGAAFGYRDSEISPNPTPGGQYFNVTTNSCRVWNGSNWQDCGGSTAANPAPPLHSVQWNNTAFGGDSFFLYDPTLHALQSPIMNSILDATQYGGAQAAITQACTGSPVNAVNITSQTPSGSFNNPCNAPVKFLTPGGEELEFHIRDFGAVGDEMAIGGNGVDTGFSISSGNNTATVTGSNIFIVGQLLSIEGAGADVVAPIPTVTPGTPLTATYHGPLVARITAVSGSTITLNHNAIRTVSFATGYWGTPNDVSINQALAACAATTLGPSARRGVIVVDPGQYMMGGTWNQVNCSLRGSVRQQSAIFFVGYNVSTDTQIPGNTIPMWASGATQLSVGYMRDIFWNGDPGWPMHGLQFDTGIDDGYRLEDVSVTGAVQDTYHTNGSINTHWYRLRADGAGRCAFGLRAPGTVGQTIISGFTYDNSKSPQAYSSGNPTGATGVSSCLVGYNNSNGSANINNNGGGIVFDTGRVEKNHTTLPGDAFVQIFGYGTANVTIAFRNVGYTNFVSGTNNTNFINFDFDSANTGIVSPDPTRISMDDVGWNGNGVPGFNNFSNSFTWQGTPHQYETPLGWSSASGYVTHARLTGDSGIFCGTPFLSMTLQGCNEWGQTVLNPINLIVDSVAVNASDWTLITPGGSGFVWTPTAAPSGSNAFIYTGTGAGSGFTRVVSRMITLPAHGTDEVISFSGYIDPSNITSGTARLQIADTSLTTLYGSITISPGIAHRYVSQAIIPAGVTHFVLDFSTNAAIVASGLPFLVSDAQVELGPNSTVYLPTYPSAGLGAVVQSATLGTSSCVLPGGTSFQTCNNTITWPSAFADTNYTYSCMGIDPVVDSGNINITLYATSTGKTVNQAEVILQNNATGTNQRFADIQCTATHN